MTLVAGRDTGAVTLQAEVERKVLTNTETVHLVNPSVSLELSTITVDTDMLFLPQRGTGRADSTLIRVTLIDETGVPLGNHTGTVQVQSTGGLLASSTAEYVDSLAAYITTMYSPTEAGEAQISATYNGELLGEEIQIRFIDVEIPQGISPNGDGLNETWILSGLDGVGSQVTVYNAQGEAVYYASPYSNEDPFLGTSNVGAMAGNELPNGTYYFRIAYGDTERNEVYNYLIIQR
ncbi:MAG TPA: hypothetical protein DCP28_36490 [Cytophagales bacterium]|nr:hypothetical protein [Cytophagales bacterium]